MNQLVDSLTRTPQTKRMGDEDLDKSGKPRKNRNTRNSGATLPSNAGPQNQVDTKHAPSDDMNQSREGSDLNLTELPGQKPDLASNVEITGATAAPNPSEKQDLTSDPQQNLTKAVSDESVEMEHTSNKDIAEMFQELPESQKTGANAPPNIDIITDAKQSTSKANKRPFNETQTEMNETQVLNDNESDEIFLQVVEQMRLEETKDKEPGSYAAVAAKKRKLSYPHAVYLHAGTEERQALPRPMFKAFEQTIWAERENLSLEENGRIKIEWLCHLKEVGVLICKDRFTSRWVKALATSF